MKINTYVVSNASLDSSKFWENQYRCSFLSDNWNDKFSAMPYTLQATVFAGKLTVLNRFTILENIFLL